MGYTLPMARIQASAQNNIAHSTKERAYMWGNNSHHKLGIQNNYKNLEVPKQVCWLVLTTATLDDSDDFEIDSDIPNMQLRTIVVDHDF